MVCRYGRSSGAASNVKTRERMETIGKSQHVCLFSPLIVVAQSGCVYRISWRIALCALPLCLPCGWHARVICGGKIYERQVAPAYLQPSESEVKSPLEANVYP